MLLKLIKKLFSVKEKEKLEDENVLTQPKIKKKVRLEAGSEKWLAYMSEHDPVKIELYYAHLGQKRELADLQNNIDKEEKRLIAFEMVPKMQASRNVRSYLEYTTGSYKHWQFIRNTEEEKAGFKCVVCGYDSKSVNEKTSKTDCHEVWHYDTKTKIQKLVKLQSLCTVCHKIKHIDQHIRNEDTFNNLLELYSVLNDITLEQARKDYDKHLAIRKNLDNILFKYLDVSILEKDYQVEDNRFECHSQEFNKFINTKFHKKEENPD